jgi:type II secretory pathway component GspD/PulD (secretin)
MQSRFHLCAWGTILAVVLAGLGPGRAVAQPPGANVEQESPGKSGKRSFRAGRARPDADAPEKPARPASPAAAEQWQAAPAGTAAKAAPAAAAQSPLGRTATAIQRALMAALAGEAPGTLRDPAAPGARVGPAPRADSKVRFQFRYQPWKDVLDWFAEQAGLSLVIDHPPPGTFNYSDDRQYTPTEAIDLLNSVLLTKGYTLVRRGRMLIVINLEDPIPKNLVPTVPLESLDTLGESELVSTLFNLDKITPEEAEAEIKKLTGPQGSVVTLPKSRQVLVTETAGRLRAIRSVLARIQSPALEETPQLEVYAVTASDPQSVLSILQTLLAGLPDVRLALDPRSGNLIALARPSQQKTIRATLEQLQREAQRVEVIRLARVDPQTAVLAITKLFGAGEAGKSSAPQVDADPTTRQLLIRATEAQISQIHSLLEKMGEPSSTATANGEKVRVLPLSGPSGRAALERLEEIWPTLRANRIRVMTPPAAAGSGGSTSGSPETSPSLSNPPRDPQAQPVTPPTPPEKPVSPETPVKPAPDPKLDAPPPPPARSVRLSGGARIVLVAAEQSTAEDGGQSPRTASGGSPGGPSSGEAKVPPKAHSVHGESPLSAEPTHPPLPPSSLIPANAETPSKPPAAQRPTAAEPPPIFVMPGPNGIVIASEDTAALDEFQRLLDTLTSGAQAAAGGTTVFYLKHAKASQAAETLERILAGNVSSPVSSAAGGQSGGAPGAAGSGSSVLGTLLQGGGARRGPVHITPDERLNALIVQANSADVDTIEQMIRVLDQKEGPEEVAISPKPRLIPVTNKDAKEIADIVREVYADRMVQTPMQAARPMMMEAMAQMYAGAAAGQRGGMGGGMGGGAGGRLGRRSDDQPKLALSVDVKSNSLIVVASDSLFQEVKQLVEQLDVMASEQKESIRVVTLHDTGSEAIRQALSAMAGPSARFTTVPGAGTQQAAAPPWMRTGGQGGAQTAAGGGLQPWQTGGFQRGQAGYGGGRGGFGMGPGGGFGMGPGGGFGAQPGMMPFQPGGMGGMQFRQGGGGGGFPGGQFRGGGPTATPIPGR